MITNEKRDKYLDLAWEPRKLWNMKVTVIPIVVGVLGTIPQGKGSWKCWKSENDPRPSKLFHCWEEPWRLEEICCHSNSGDWLSANAGIKKKLAKNDIIIKTKNKKKLWNMRVMVIPIVVGAFGTVLKGIEKGLEQLETC